MSKSGRTDGDVDNDGDDIAGDPPLKTTHYGMVEDGNLLDNAEDEAAEEAVAMISRSSPYEDDAIGNNNTNNARSREILPFCISVQRWIV